MNDRQFNILIVDDNQNNIQVFSTILNKYGYSISVALNGQQAIEYARKEVPDLILMDVMMPDMDGFETCLRLKSDPVTNEIPVIFLSARAESVDVVQGFEVGGTDYVIKPVDSKELITRVNTHLELSYNKRELRRLNEEKAVFLGIAAHDLNNSLYVINTAAEFCLEQLKDIADEDVKLLLKTIYDTGHFMSELVGNLLEFSINESGKTKLSLKPTEYFAFVESKLPMNRIFASSKEIQINFKADGAEVTLELDQLKIAQVINNLISNAIKFSQPKTTVTLDVSTQDGKVITRVTDEGPGIPEEDMDKLFKPFEKGTARPTAKERSTGLGLSIVHRIIKAHKGSIQVESELGKGTSFIFHLPIK